MNEAMNGWADGLSPDNLYHKSLNPTVPDQERNEARTELDKQFIGAHNMDEMTRSFTSQVMSMMESGEFEKAVQEQHRKSASIGDYVENAYSAWVRPDGRIERPMNITFQFLRRISREIPIMQAILSLRRRQMLPFCQVPEAPGRPGFVVAHRDKEHETSKEEQNTIKTISDFILNSGFESDARERTRVGRVAMTDFMMQVVEDSLILDAIAVETEPNRRGDGMVGFYAMDSSFIRLIDYRTGYERDKEIFFVEIDSKDTVRATFTLEEAFYYIRNKTSAIERYGYGNPEIERLLRVLNGFMMSLQYNFESFNRNAIPRGFLQLFGNYNRESLQQLKREMMAQMMGTSFRFSYPILAAREKSAAAEWVNTQQSFDEMGYARWIGLLTSLTCALYGVSPEEINLDSFNTRSGGGISGTDTAERMASAKDKGFMPFVSHIELMYNEYILPTLDDRFKLRMVGIDKRDEAAVRDQKKSVMTNDEQRAELGMKPHADPMMGASPLDPQAMQLYIQTALAPEGGEGGPAPEEAEEQPGPGEKTVEEIAEKPKSERTTKAVTRFDGLLRI